MILIFSSHAARRLLERSLNRQMVIDTLSIPDNQFVNEGLGNAVKLFGDKALVVVFRKTGDVYFIVTVIFTSKIKKYL
ncbi:MAG TPA: DUF4258 domain-containing protein [Candidatus Acidoferrum sp.]|nr:DUF4258 domain-containing protein [Candidatus Acidoferrum sp.]